MGILIKNMNLPDKDHLILVEIDSNGDVFAAYDSGRTKLTQYKARLVPEPHGDLIDRDTIDYYEVERNGEEHYMVWKPHIDGMPTIIPASEDEIGEAQRDYQAAVDYQQYCETYEQTYDPDTGAM